MKDQLYGAKIMECVPNISSSDPGMINKIIDLVHAQPKVKLLHTDIGNDANRTVLTMVGPPNAVVEVMVQLYRICMDLDITTHDGEHPKIGSIDVCPMVPLVNMDIREASYWARSLATKISALEIPIFLYEYSSNYPHRKRLEQIRQGGLKGLKKRMTTTEWQPDLGPIKLHPRFGATVIGAREILIAYNLSLDTTDVKIAQRIARRLRSNGYKRSNGLLPDVKAIGWFMEEYQCAQVSTNITNHLITPVHTVNEWVEKLAEVEGCQLVGAELIGLIPERCLVKAGHYYSRDLRLESKDAVQIGIKGLKLNWKEEFMPNERVLDYLI